MSINLVPGLSSKSDSTRSQNIFTLHTFSGNFILKTCDAEDVLLIGNNKWLHPNLRNIYLFTIFLIEFTFVEHTLQWKQVSCHWCPLYSIFLVPSRKVFPQPSHFELRSLVIKVKLAKIFIEKFRYLIITSSTEYVPLSCSKWLIYQAFWTFSTLKTCFMPVKIFVAHISWLQSNKFSTSLTRACKVVFITRNACWPLIC